MRFFRRHISLTPLMFFLSFLCLSQIMALDENSVYADELEILRFSGDTWKTDLAKDEGKGQTKCFLPAKGWQISAKSEDSAILSRLIQDPSDPGKNLWSVETEQPAVFRYNFQSPFHVKNYRVQIECNGTGSIALRYGTKKEMKDLQTFPLANSRSTFVWEVSRAGIRQLTDLVRHRENLLEFIVRGKISIYSISVIGFSYPAVKVTGKLEAMSPIPKHTSGEYPDCFQVGTFSVSRVMPEQAFPARISCNFLSVINRRANDFAWLKKNEILDLYILPFSSLSDAEQGTMQFDTLNEFELDSFFVLGFQRRKYLPESEEQMTASNEYTSAFSVSVNPPQTERAESMRQKTLTQELERAESLYADGCKKLEQRKTAIAEELAESGKKYQTMGQIQKLGSKTKSDGSNFLWAKIGKSFFALPKNYASRLQYFQPSMDKTPNYLASFKALNEFCKFHNVHLIVVLIPDLHDIAARKMLSSMRDIPNVSVIKEQLYLLRNGIETVDPTEAILSEENQEELSFLYPENGHPAWGCQNAVAKIVLQRLQRYDIPPKFVPENFSETMELGWGEKTYYWPEGVDVSPHKPFQMILQRTIHLKNEKGTEVTTDEASPVLVCGNSYIQSPMNYASLALRMAELSGIMPHNFYCGDSGVSSRLPRTLFREYEKYLKNKKVLILSFHYYCLRNYPWVNVRKEDEQMLFLSGSEEICKFMPFEKNNDRCSVEKTTLKDIVFGSDVIEYSTGEKLIPIPKDIQEKYADGTYFLQIRIAGDNSANLTLRYDDQTVPVEKGAIHPTWQTVIIPYRKELNLKISGKGFFALKEIVVRHNK